MKIVTVGHTENGTPITKLVESFWDKYVFTISNAWLSLIAYFAYLIYVALTS